MKAAFYKAYGAATHVLEVGDADVPEVGPDDVRVRVHYSGINPSDCIRRRGLRERLNDPFIVPHNDGAGIIESVGKNVSSSRIGERVWIWNGQRDGRTMGTAAEYIVLHHQYAIRLPENVSFEEGACFGVPVMTAYASLFAEGPVEGLSILVCGGAGAVGHYAIQLARLAGAKCVIATVSSDTKAKHAAEARPHHIVNYRLENVFDRVMSLTNDTGVDRISEVNFAANVEIDCKVIARHGAIGVYGSPSGYEPELPIRPLIAKHVTVRFIQCNILPMSFREEGTQLLTQMASRGDLVNSIGRVFELDQVAEAHRAVESGDVIGNVLLKIS